MYADQTFGAFVRAVAALVALVFLMGAAAYFGGWAMGQFFSRASTHCQSTCKLIGYEKGRRSHAPDLCDCYDEKPGSEVWTVFWGPKR